MRRAVGVATAVLVGVLATGCNHSDDQPSPASPEPTPDPTPSSTEASATSSSASTPGGTSDAPAPVTATIALLDWTPVEGDVMASVVTNGTWTLTVDASGSAYTLAGDDRDLGSSAGAGLKIGDALMDDRWAVAVAQDSREAGTRPDQATVTDLSNGRQFGVDGSSDVPTTTGGTWAIDGDTLVHATIGPGGAYCLATVDLTTRTATLGFCAEKRHGFNAARVTPTATSILSFDDARPSCRTVGTVSGTTFTPFTGVTPCAAWEGAMLGADSAIWSVIPKENQVEAADFVARVGDQYVDLGAGTSGTLVPCHGSAYFVRDPQRDGQPASLMRWDGTTLATVYQAPPGQSFLQAPRCGEDALTVTALSEGGDEQVTAPLT